MRGVNEFMPISETKGIRKDPDFQSCTCSYPYASRNQPFTGKKRNVNNFVVAIRCRKSIQKQGLIGGLI